jgi:hypothetical protein
VLKGFGCSGFMIANSARNAVIEATRVDCSFKLRIARLQILLVKPQIQWTCPHFWHKKLRLKVHRMENLAWWQRRC